jgi:hypothetical protein
MEEPLLIAIMRRNPTGQVRFLPDGRPMTGTSTAGFLAEFDAYIESVRVGNE